MGEYVVPKNIRDLKPRGSVVKKINNKFYVYEQFNRKVDGKWKIKSGKLLGRIDEEKGFIPNNNYHNKEEVTTYEYGQYACSVNSSNNTLKKLLKIFNPKDAYTIYLLSIIHIVNGFIPLKDVQSYFEQSYLSQIHQDLSFTYYTLSNLLDALGRRQGKVFEFEQMLIDDSSKEIAIDGHDIKSTSHENDLAEKGNKFNSMKDMQLNVLMAYDINNGNPLVSRAYPGSVLDKGSIGDLLEFNEYKDILFIVDRGFYSNDNIKLFSLNDNHYIIPLAMNLNSYKEATKDMNFHDIFVYERNKKTTPIEYKKVISEDKTRIIIYRDLVQNAKDKADYLKNIELDPEKYTKEKYEQIKDFFGLIVLQTNLDKDIEEVYKLYKKRWSIETYFNYFKNRIDINALELNDYYKTQGLSFIMLITGLIYRELRDEVKKIKGKSIDDCLLEARFLKLNYKNNIYTVSKVKKASSDLVTMLNVDTLNPLGNKN